MAATRPVFIRLPENQADRLDRACAAQHMTKQAFVSSAVLSRLDGVDAHTSLVAGDCQPDVVLTLEEVAALLRLDESAVRTRVEAGDLPGRRFGDEWRFSRAGVMSWLAAAEEHGRRAAGFEAPRPSR